MEEISADESFVEDRVPTTKITPLKMPAQTTDQKQPHSLVMDHSRLIPLSEVRDSSRVKKIAPADGNDGGEEETSGVIFIAMDNADGTMTERTSSILSESRRSSSLVDHRPSSETNDTDHDDHEEDDQGRLDNNNNENSNTNDNTNDLSMRHSISSSTTDRPSIPVMLIDRQRSSSTTSSTSTRSLRKRNPSPEPKQQPQATRSRNTSSVNPPTTIQTSEETSHSRRPSATEFQKFRDQLHTPLTPTFPLVNNIDWRLYPNPHHPKTKTEILRIERIYTPVELPSKSRVSEVTNYDVLIPRFSPAFPPVLRDIGVQEDEWTGFIHRVNKYSMEAFDPFRWSNIVFNIIHVLTFWMSEWILPNLTKKVHPL
jgi:hypothetical protein